MKSVARALVALALSAHLGTGCGSPSPVAPSDPLTGAWTGTIVDSILGPGILTMTMTQVGSGAAGAWSATFKDGAGARSGSLSATINRSAVSLFLTPTTSVVCSPAVTLSGTLAVAATLSGSELGGTYVVLACMGTTTGNVKVARAG